MYQLAKKGKLLPYRCRSRRISAYIFFVPHMINNFNDNREKSAKNVAKSGRVCVGLLASNTMKFLSY